jgi:ABC-type sugar transport system ATPase subunit
MTLGDRIVVLADGRIQQIGRPIELYSAPLNRFVAGFIGTPSMNFLEGVLETENGRTYFRGEGARLRLREGTTRLAPKERVVLGIRPEDLLVGYTDQGSTRQSSDVDTLTGRVVLVERLGGTSHVHFEVGPHRLLASVSNESLPQVGDNITARVPAVRAHLFGADGRTVQRESTIP